MNSQQQKNKDSIIAASVTFAVALLLLLVLFFCGLKFDPSLLAAASTPEISVETLEEEEEFLEPEIVEDLGERNATAHDEPAPVAKGDPEPAPVENNRQLIKDNNPKPAPPVEKPVTQTKESPVKNTTPSKSDEEKQKVTSKMADKFPGNNGSKTGKEGSSGAGGSGVGAVGSVTGRTYMGCQKPVVELQNKVVVVVHVTINSSGKVTKATARTKSGKASGAILSACERAAMTARWNEDKDTPSATGTLTFTITPN